MKCSSVESVPPPQADPVSVTGYDGPRRRLLVVDDNRDNRDVLREAMESLDFTVTEAADGEEALGRLEQDNPDLVLCDLLMPGMNGFTFVRKVRDSDRYRSLPVVAVSASVMDIESIKRNLQGFDAILAKPIQLHELVETIGKLLRLDWVSDGVTANTEGTRMPTDGESGSPAQPADSLPPPAVLDNWLGHCQRGDVAALRSGIESYKLDSPWLREFSTKVKNFQLDQAGSMIEQALSSPGHSRVKLSTD